MTYKEWKALNPNSCFDCPLGREYFRTGYCGLVDENGKERGCDFVEEWGKD